MNKNSLCKKNISTCHQLLTTEIIQEKNNELIYLPFYEKLSTLVSVVMCIDL